MLRSTPPGAHPLTFSDMAANALATLPDARSVKKDSLAKNDVSGALHCSASTVDQQRQRRVLQSPPRCMVLRFCGGTQCQPGNTLPDCGRWYFASCLSAQPIG